MADLAIAFHWRLADLDALSLTDLCEWRERARVRLEPKPARRP